MPLNCRRIMIILACLMAPAAQAALVCHAAESCPYVAANPESSKSCEHRQKALMRDTLNKAVGPEAYAKLAEWEKSYTLSDDGFGDAFCIQNNAVLFIPVYASHIGTGLQAIVWDALPTEAAVTQIIGGFCSIVQPLKDKSGNDYLFMNCNDLSHGVSSHALGLVNATSYKNTPYKTLSRGVEDGESGGCARHEFLQITDALLATNFTLEDANNDTVPDIRITTRTEHCATQKITTATHLYLATDHGFELRTHGQ